MQIESYDIDLEVDFAKARLKGKVGIKVKGANSPFRLDAAEMRISSVNVNGRPSSFKHDKARSSLRVTRVPRKWSLVEVTYSKQVSDEVIFGLYKSKYGKDYILATDLEPAEASKVFPCVDHPAYKAVFRLTLTTERGLKAISNTALASLSMEPGGRAKFVFKPTPRMSTYLLFFAVGKMDELKRRFGGKQLIVAAREGEAKNGKFIADFSGPILQEYGRYFGIPYPLDKLHIVALPEYHTGAMENWGAISSRESFVLLDENSGTLDKRAAAMVIAHEIAHQWFGDLVTMKWWDDLWLNESFASFMEYKMTARLHPDWDPWAVFQRFGMFRSQEMDALSTTHPIQARIRTPAESNQVVDAIIYGKGASVLRMMEAYVGDEPFRKGVAAYLKRFRYSNATGQDLWKSIGKTSGQPIASIMAAWVTMEGLPLVRVKHSDGKLTFTQSRFQLNGEEPPSTWPIPLTMEVNGERINRLFDTKKMSMEVPKLESLNVNLGHTGFYSVLGDESVYKMLASRFHSLAPDDKGGLMSDLHLFLLAGKVEPRTYFEFVNLCCAEAGPLVVEVVADQLLSLHSIAGWAESVRSATVNFTTAQLERLGLKGPSGEDPRQGIVREAVASLAARVGTKFSGELAGLFSEYDLVDANLKEAVAIAYSLEQPRSAYDRLESMVKSTSNEVDRGRLYYAMTASAEPDLVVKTLDLGVSGEVSRSDSAYPLIGASMNYRARDTLWDWIKTSYDKLWKMYAGSQQILLYYQAVVPRCAIGRVDDAKRFFVGSKMKQGGMVYRRILESLEINSRLLGRLLES